MASGEGRAGKPCFEGLEARLLLSADSISLALLTGAESVAVEAAGAVTVQSQLQDKPFDVYHFVTPARGTMYIDMSSPEGALDPMLKLLNYRGRRVRVNDNASQNTQDSLIRIKVRSGQNYYLVADGKGAQGAYRVRFTSDPADDYGNTIATAKTVTLSRRGTASVSGTINYDGDLDMFKLTPAKSGMLSLSITARKSPVDPELAVFDAGGNELATASGAGAAAAMDVSAGQAYYIQASSRDGIGRYSLSLSLKQSPVPAPPPPEPPPMIDDPRLTPGVSVTARVVHVAGGLELQVAGTDGSDSITLSQTDAGMTLVSAAGAQEFAGAFVGAAVCGFGGSDVIRTTYSVSVGAYLSGGDGGDQLFANGQGGATLVGGAGDDLLVSIGGAAATLTGGDGSDSFWHDSGDQVADASPAEQAAGALHKVSQFYQPTSYLSGLVGLAIDGQNIVDPAASYAYSSFAGRPLFVDAPEFNDIRQGALGDCYFLAALSSLADTDGDVLTQMIAPLGDGSYGVRYYRGGTEYYLRVDSQLPVSGSAPAYAKLTPDGELWVALVEKAYAQFRNGQNSYASISGGWMDAVYREVTGNSADYLPLSSYTDSCLADLIYRSLTDGHAVSAGSYLGAASPIVGGHAYGLRGIQNVSGDWYVTVYNPWGYDGASWDGNPGDGLLTITLSMFRSSFSALCISQA